MRNDGAYDDYPEQQVIREVREIHHHNDGPSSGFAKWKDGLMLAGTLALIGIVWNLSINVAEMRVEMRSLASQIIALRDGQ